MFEMPSLKERGKLIEETGNIRILLITQVLITERRFRT